MYVEDFHVFILKWWKWLLALWIIIWHSCAGLAICRRLWKVEDPSIALKFFMRTFKFVLMEFGDHVSKAFNKLFFFWVFFNMFFLILLFEDEVFVVSIFRLVWASKTLNDFVHSSLSASSSDVVKVEVLRVSLMAWCMFTNPSRSRMTLEGGFLSLVLCLCAFKVYETFATCYIFLFEPFVEYNGFVLTMWSLFMCNLVSLWSTFTK